MNRILQLTDEQSQVVEQEDDPINVQSSTEQFVLLRKDRFDRMMRVLESEEIDRSFYECEEEDSCSVKILDRLPFDASASIVSTQVGSLEIRPYQIVVWVSLRAKGVLSRPFPAVLDTGLNHNLAINESVLQSWLNLIPGKFEHWGFAKVEGEQIPVKMADVLLHPNVRGERTMSNKEPFPLETPQGFLVFQEQRPIHVFRYWAFAH